MNELGATIKKLRKERKMTLVDVAGDRLTKGMLSLIENGKAQPSMESLRFIAKQLGVEVTLLLNDRSIEELRQLLLEIEEDLKAAEEVFGSENYNTAKQAIANKIEPHLSKLVGKYFEEIRLLSIYATIQLQLGKNKDTSIFNKIIQQYKAIHAFSYAIKCYSVLCWDAFNRRDYEGAVEYMEQCEREMRTHEFLIDDLVKLDVYYNLAVTYAAVNNYEQTALYTDKAIDIAKKKKIFYRIDDFYRFNFIREVEKGDREKSLYYLEKVQLLTEFSDDLSMRVGAKFMEAHYYNFVEKNYKFTLEILQNFKESIDPDLMRGMLLSPIFFVEKAYALWSLDKFEEAIEALKELKVPVYHNHPIDIMFLFTGFAVRALCYYRLGDFEEAKQDILYAADGVKNFYHSIYSTFINDAYETIMQ
ncbi:helix-turn-helix domain-containing protein [Lysinibacillus sp. 54212]|uniref:helix-turn-helix domain-containing protein n=1 Tax=Lysinibacillus sp. 54212 TaxID=3119829 RepID=UPI002FC92A22